MYATAAALRALLQGSPGARRYTAHNCVATAAAAAALPSVALSILLLCSGKAAPCGEGSYGNATDGSSRDPAMYQVHVQCSRDALMRVIRTVIRRSTGAPLVSY